MPTLVRDQDTPERFLASAAQAWTHGAPVNWHHLHPPTPHTTTVPLDPVVDGPEPAREDTATERFWEAVEEQDAEELATALSLAGDAEAEASLRAVLPALSAWRRRRRHRTAVARWRYDVVWEPTAAPPASSPASTPLAGEWLVLTPKARGRRRTPARQAADRLLRVLTDLGATARKIVCDTHGDPRDSLPALPSGSRPAGILSLLALDESLLPGHPDVPSGLMATGRLVREVHRTHPDTRLWVVTTGAVMTGSPDGEPLARPVQALVTGLLRAAVLEYPHPLTHLDLPVSPDDPAVAARLAEALAQPPAETQVAVRADGVHVPRLAHAPDTPSGPDGAWQPPAGTTLITGGSGALAAHTARWLARRGAPHLLLLSRSGDRAPNAGALRAELERHGARVTFAACDIADAEGLADALAGIPAEHPLTAVFHTAGIVDDGLLDSATPEQLTRLLRPKLRGTLNLHEATKDRELSAFVLFSSGANLLPNAGQSGYAAANAYLDAFARHRRAAGLPATSIAWGAWDGGGLARTEDPGSWLNRNGIRPMDPEAAVAVMEHLLVRDETFALVADVDWARFLESESSGRPRALVSGLPEVAERHSAARPGGADGGADGSDPQDSEEPPLLRQLRPLPEAQRDAVLLDAVCAEAARVLGHPDTSALDPGKPFRDLGFDSVTGLELRNRVAALSGVRLAPTAVFDFPTPERLVERLLEQLGPLLGDDGGAADGRPADAEAQGRTATNGSPSNGAEADGAAADGGSALDAMGVEELLRVARGQGS
ncbi:SDR family NAD(P)-dependent oxidoreductase [Streptomyces sp. YIM 98790]|uniref:SDR family NAD(P)-dependent oxidoreductase n=1 Tax=Streptomyces sp. YIM 98790 TaxID=2689077 RepID=UPI0028BE3D06|nr:SDR family NAD(P)-dependent oxidoreductase [Streptomyces sp. YIM 98790]